MSSWPVRAALASALALAAAPALAAEPFSKTVFFGDSLTDSGHFRPVLVQMIGPQGAILGRFTTNPGLVWSEHLADRYGTDASANGNGQGGDNYAVGGARVGVDSVGGLGFTPSLVTQTTSYLAANGGRADADALYSVWGGANDLFSIAADPTQAPQIIGAAVAAQVGIVGTLQGAGARYVMVPSIPDIGLTPASRAGGAAAMAQGTALATAYNDALYGGLAAQGLRVIPVDTFHFLQEVVADPGLYGFANVTSPGCGAQPPPAGDSSLFCNPNSLLDPSAADTYLFADGIHPASRAHALIADLAISMIDGPQQIAVLPQSAAMTGRARADRIAHRLSFQPGEADGRRWWVDVRGDFQRYDHGKAYDGAGPAVTAGIDWNRGNATFGGFLGYGRQGNDWGLRRGSWDQGEASVGGFVGWHADGGAWVNAQLSYSWLDFDIDRTVQIGPATRVHHGDADGSNLTAAVNAGWNFGDGRLQHGPVLSLVAQRIEVDGFAESDPTLSSSLAYPSQDFDSLIGSAGWQFAYAAGDSLRPYARLTVDREFEDVPAEAWAWSQSLPSTLPYAVPARGYDRSYGSLTFGAQTRVSGLEANLGATLTVGQKGGSHATVFATVGGGF
ncbi:autotransporter domain-containing protein [Luteimonas sp. BDR2-5]|uniref:autotransporter domain-containing protein n=1 Tax=Proluteimonas luteida TaxID=2878685 RepID=UPI001E5E06C5|nr:autotransporter domain-containing protein [Luteimonas sp. BDR2-5]MCD9027467.1 autotransporter domain-containing protein [Luteimonas sp. BDR2-5]